MAKWIACLSSSENVVCFPRGLRIQRGSSTDGGLTPPSSSQLPLRVSERELGVPCPASLWRTQTGTAWNPLSLSLSARAHMRMSAWAHVCSVVPCSVSKGPQQSKENEEMLKKKLCLYERRRKRRVKLGNSNQDMVKRPSVLCTYEHRPQIQVESFSAL